MYFKLLLLLLLSHKQGQGLKPSAAHLYSDIGRVTRLPQPPPPPPQGGKVKCQVVESRNYNSGFSFLFFSVCEKFCCYFQVVYFLPGGQGRTCTIQEHGKTSRVIRGYLLLAKLRSSIWSGRHTHC